MFVNFLGGYVEFGDMIFDVICFIILKVIMIGFGSVVSVGVLIYVVVDKENCYLLFNICFFLY